MSSRLAALYGRLPWFHDKSEGQYTLCTQLIVGKSGYLAQRCNVFEYQTILKCTQVMMYFLGVFQYPVVNFVFSKLLAYLKFCVSKSQPYDTKM